MGRPRLAPTAGLSYTLLLACGLSVLPWPKRKIDLVGLPNSGRDGIIFLCRVGYRLDCIRGVQMRIRHGLDWLVRVLRSLLFREICKTHGVRDRTWISRLGIMIPFGSGIA